jgi:hypothetical protein
MFLIYMIYNDPGLYQCIPDKATRREYDRTFQPCGLIVSRWYKNEVKVLAQTGTFSNNSKQQYQQ